MTRGGSALIALVLAAGCTTPAPQDRADADETQASDGSASSVAVTEPDPEPPVACVPEAFVHAPAPVVVDGLAAAPIDILELDAALRFDVPSASVNATATVKFQLGEAGGMPILDLRQVVSTLTLDGRPLPADALARHDFGLGLDAGASILAVTLPACSVHTLTLDYAIATPAAIEAVGPRFTNTPAAARFDLASSDLEAGRYLESWLPANMIWDRHPIHLDIRLDGADVPHALISSADPKLVAPHHWQIEFPGSSTAMDPMLALLPEADVDSITGSLVPADGPPIPYTVHVDHRVQRSAKDVAVEVEDALRGLVPTLGDYPHPSVTVHVIPSGRSMEYAGATTTTLAALEHELFHSWWGRGVHPATCADGWIDEAWNMWETGNPRGRPIAFDWTRPPTRLWDPHPFARRTADQAYVQGRLVFAGIAELMGEAALREAMAELYRAAGPLGSLTTAQLERHLHCASGAQPEVRRGFHRFVYGLDGSPGATSACP